MSVLPHVAMCPLWLSVPYMKLEKNSPLFLRYNKASNSQDSHFSLVTFKIDILASGIALST